MEKTVTMDLREYNRLVGRNKSLEEVNTKLMEEKCAVVRCQEDASMVKELDRLKYQLKAQERELESVKAGRFVATAIIAVWCGILILSTLSS